MVNVTRSEISARGREPSNRVGSGLAAGRNQAPDRLDASDQDAEEFS